MPSAKYSAQARFSNMLGNLRFPASRSLRSGITLTLAYLFIEYIRGENLLAVKILSSVNIVAKRRIDFCPKNNAIYQIEVNIITLPSSSIKIECSA